MLFAPSRAHAFCRTTTAGASPSHDSSKLGCPLKFPDGRDGLPLFWRNACIGYDLAFPTGRQVAYDKAAAALQGAFTVWTGVTCPTEGVGQSRVSIDVRDLGPVDCAAVEQKSRAPNQNVVLFRDFEWKYDKQVLGLTTVTFSPTTGEIFGADMEINTKEMKDKIVFDSPLSVPVGVYDFQSIVTHEAGHFLGIGHSDVVHSTMYAEYHTSEIFGRVLSPDDINAVCTIYRPDGTRSVLNGKERLAPGCDPTPRGGFSQACEDNPSAGPCAVGRAPGKGAMGGAGPSFILMLALLLRRAKR